MYYNFRVFKQNKICIVNPNKPSFVKYLVLDKNIGYNEHDIFLIKK